MEIPKIRQKLHKNFLLAKKMFEMGIKVDSKTVLLAVCRQNFQVCREKFQKGPEITCFWKPGGTR